MNNYSESVASGNSSEQPIDLTNSPDIKPFKRSTYNVTFPIGSMGLELEPVIISSESRIGCRVRGYYFAADHKGIARADLETNVNIGDIITTIEGQSMISMTFEEIIVLLGESRNKIRTIGFKSVDPDVTTPTKHRSSSSSSTSNSNNRLYINNNENINNHHQNEVIKVEDNMLLVTPTKKNKYEADLSQVYDVANEISKKIKSYKIIINKSTVPVTTGDKVEKIISKINKKSLFSVVSNPEFLREGEAIRDFIYPDRIVIGTSSQKSNRILKNLYSPLISKGAKYISTSRRAAELIKYASNAFLATKITFINEI